MARFEREPDSTDTPPHERPAASTSGAICAHLESFDRLVQVGIGRRTDVADALLERGCRVTATDVHDRPVPEGVRFVVDDVTEPTLEVYADADAVYGLNLPPELHRPILEVGRQVGAAVCFTTLGGDPPLVPVERVALPRETLFVARALER